MHERDELATHTINFIDLRSIASFKIWFSFYTFIYFLTVMKGLFHPLRNIILYKLHHKQKQEPGALFCCIDQTISPRRRDSNIRKYMM